MALTKLKVLTLNCWGVFVPIACQLRSERMQAIAAEIAKGEYDIVILEEVWTQSDYNKLCSKILGTMLYTHYFHSGSYGSGVCLFSKYPILETTTFRYTLNGYAHRIFHGDWYCAKAVGLARIHVGDLRVNVYGTHLHAQYADDLRDEYEHHRVLQSFELGQFIKNTSEACDVVLVGGDLNLRPDQLGYKIIRSVGNLEDSWITRKLKPEGDTEEMTCDRPDNSFTKSPVKDHPQGIRLDYLLYSQNCGLDIDCEQCYLTMRKVPDQSYNYSDHEGVAAVYTIKRNVTTMNKLRNSRETEQNLGEAIMVLNRGVQRIKSKRVYCLVAFLLGLCTLAFISSVDLPAPLNLLSSLACLVLTLLLGQLLWMAGITLGREMNDVVGLKKDINNMITSMHML